MPQTKLIVVHDVLGTVFSLEAPTKVLLNQYPDLDPKLAELIIYDWYHAVQRDYTNLSINNDYKPISLVFKSTLARILSQAALKPEVEPSSKVQESASKNLYPSLTEAIMASLPTLGPRPKMVEAFNHTYRDKEKVPKHIGQVDVWGATNGGTELARKLFKTALGENGDELVQGSGNDRGKGVGIFSCDEIKVAKPAPEVYEAIKTKAGVGKDGNEVAWFVATHSWDTYAAKRAGFRTAWVANEEHFTCPDVYGTPDIIGKDLEDVATQILAWEGKDAPQ